MHASTVSMPHTAVDDAGVAHHVGVGEVDDDERVVPLGQPLEHRVADPWRAHLGREVVGRHVLGRRHQHAPLALERPLAPAVEEEGDVRVLLGLGDMELAPAGPRGDLGEPLAHVLGLEEGRDVELGLVAGHRGQRRERRVRPRSKPSKAGSPSAIVSWRARSGRKFQKDPVVPADPVLARRADHRGLEELVRDAGGVQASTAARPLSRASPTRGPARRRPAWCAASAGRGPSPSSGRRPSPRSHRSPRPRPRRPGPRRAARRGRP